MTANTTCPHTEQLPGLVDRTLPDHLQTQLEQHVDECDICLRALEDLVSDDAALSFLAEGTQQSIDKDDSFRSALVGTGNVLAKFMTGVSLPPSFMPPRQSDAKRVKYRRAIRPAAKHQINKGLYPGKSERPDADVAEPRDRIFTHNFVCSRLTLLKVTIL